MYSPQPQFESWPSCGAGDLGFIEVLGYFGPPNLMESEPSPCGSFWTFGQALVLPPWQSFSGAATSSSG